MAAHAFGAAAYAAQAAGLAAPERPTAVTDETRWQLCHTSPAAGDILRQLPPLGRRSPGTLGSVIRGLQRQLTAAQQAG